MLHHYLGEFLSRIEIIHNKTKNKGNMETDSK